jgi:hypothetical protein
VNFAITLHLFYGHKVAEVDESHETFRASVAAMEPKVAGLEQMVAEKVAALEQIVAETVEILRDVGSD